MPPGDSVMRGFRALPPRWRERIKRLTGALGHEPGWAHRFRARHLAATRRRLDAVSEDLAGRLRFAEVERLDGRDCLEFGTGHLLSEVLAYHLAGARRAVAVDYFPILQASEMHRACEGADAERIVAALAPFADAAQVRSRARALLGREHWSLESLSRLGVSYVAPHDAARGPLEVEAFDVITSGSVLEHLPNDRAGAIVANLFAMLAPGGRMVHVVHLEDHRDFAGAPFAFLAEDTDWTERDADTRGNRVRASEWIAMAQALPGAAVTWRSWVRDPGALPKRLHPRFVGCDRADLCTGSLMLAVAKPPEAGTPETDTAAHTPPVSAS